MQNAEGSGDKGGTPDVLIEGPRAYALALKAKAAQDGQFSQMKNAIGIPHKDDDLVAVFLLSTYAHS